MSDGPQDFGHAVSNGSFSKIAGPGVRTGWLEGTPAFVLGLSKTAATMSGGAPSQLAAGILAQLVQTGNLENFIEEKTRPTLQRRHRLMTEAIKEHISPFGVELLESSLPEENTYGGYFVWLDTPKGLPSELVAKVAKEEENLIIASGNMFEVHGDEASVKFDTNIRLCFSWEPEEDIVEGVKRLARVLRKIQDNRAHYVNRETQSADHSIIANFK